MSVTLKSSTTISVTCSSGTSFAIGLDVGTHSTGAGSTAQRYLANGSSTIAYELCRDSGCSVPWGDGTNAGSTVAGSAYASGGAQPFLVFSLITVPLSASVGTYTDTISVKVSF
jgi:spore coat protein U-like protein